MIARFSRLAPLALAATLSGCAQTAGYAQLGMEAIARDIEWRMRPNPSAWRLESPPLGARQRSLPTPVPAGALAESVTSVCWLHAAPDLASQEDPCRAPGAIPAARLNAQPAFPARYLVVSRSERRTAGYVGLARYKIEPSARASAIFEPADLLRGQPLALSRLSVVIATADGPEYPRELRDSDRSRMSGEIPPAPYALLFYEPADTTRPAHTDWANSEYHYPLLSPRLLAMSPLRFPPPAAGASEP